jgi:hypothetical protein
VKPLHQCSKPLTLRYPFSPPIREPSSESIPQLKELARLRKECQHEGDALSQPARYLSKPSVPEGRAERSLGREAAATSTEGVCVIAARKGVADFSLSSRPGGPEPNVSPAREGWVSNDDDGERRRRGTPTSAPLLLGPCSGTRRPPPPTSCFHLD